jgi:two-component system LytT family response regulator
MNNSTGIKTAIIDDNKECLDSLVDHLYVFPEIEICGYATHYKEARELLMNEKPDLVFMDIEMPGKNGFELLNEMRCKGCDFSVIFYTAYYKYMIQALREAAFDFILKPVKPEELRNAIIRFKKRQAEQNALSARPSYQATNGLSNIVAMPTNLGLRFVDTNRILLFRSIRGSMFEKSSWEALLTDLTPIKLSINTTAEKITQLMSNGRFLPINQSCIINLNYLCNVEFKSHDCLLLPPFNNIKLTVSRSHLAKLREIYEIL